ncbi:MAG: DNA photolyase [Gammaproteobacteria bacterium]|nr:DNA photolyase [Gammaproteobacteria bacterium]
MVDLIYRETALRGDARAESVLRRFPKASVVECERYGEVFNPKAQNFRLQKKRPALILARKHRRRVLPAPPGYGVGGAHNYYFSHMLNCVYDCRYCFLQGMFRSAHYVLFVNFESFQRDMDELLARHAGGPVWFFSGYDCDSLALDGMSGFADAFLPFFAGRPRAFLELRTKSTQVSALLRRTALPNVVTAFSFTPGEISRALEHGVPSIAKRIKAIARLQRNGWPVALRFDPLMDSADFRGSYARLFDAVFAVVDAGALHSVSLGAFRMPRNFYKNTARLFPGEPLFARAYATAGGVTVYPPQTERAMVDFCADKILRHVPAQKFFHNTAAADAPGV